MKTLQNISNIQTTEKSLSIWHVQGVRANNTLQISACQWLHRIIANLAPGTNEGSWDPPWESRPLFALFCSGMWIPSDTKIFPFVACKRFSHDLLLSFVHHVENPLIMLRNHIITLHLELLSLPYCFGFVFLGVIFHVWLKMIILVGERNEKIRMRTKRNRWSWITRTSPPMGGSLAKASFVSRRQGSTWPSNILHQGWLRQ